MNDSDEIVNNASQDDNGRDTSRISLSPEGAPPNEDKLMAYLEGKLLPEEQYEIEKWLNEDGLESDALEGLRSLPASESKNSIDRLNYNLHSTLRNKKRGKIQARPDQTILVAIVIILLLAVAAYVVIRLVAHK